IQLTGKNNYTKVYEKWKHTENGKGKTMKEMATLITTDVETAMLVSFIYWQNNKINQYVAKDTITEDSCKKVGGMVNRGNAKLKALDEDDRINKTKEVFNAL
ncbi:MAG: hypothetical protein OIF50_08060, partial [Flavobacteriaceae bacterium]|nr:hypothetical protein [Flavobacteriaceae bacterium]